MRGEVCRCAERGGLWGEERKTHATPNPTFLDGEREGEQVWRSVTNNSCRGQMDEGDRRTCVCVCVWVKETWGGEGKVVREERMHIRVVCVYRMYVWYADKMDE